MQKTTANKSICPNNLKLIATNSSRVATQSDNSTV